MSCIAILAAAEFLALVSRNNLNVFETANELVGEV